MQSLRCIFNVETNLLNNMPYELLFERGIHVVTTGAVFAEPVAELGLAMALNLARNIVDADLAFRNGAELWGGDGNQTARLLSGSEIGIIGFGDLGRALNRLLAGFRATIQRVRSVAAAVDPGRQRRRAGEPRRGAVEQRLRLRRRLGDQREPGLSRRRRLRQDAQGRRLHPAQPRRRRRFPGADGRRSRSGHIVAASDVFPEEPLAHDHPVRTLPGFLRSAHRAGALDIAFKRMGDMVLEDMDLIDRGLPPLRGKRAERETVSRMRSKPVDRN